MCDHGGEYRGTSSTKKTGTRKTSCPFSLVAKKDLKHLVWTLAVKEGKHNHEPAQQLEGHPYAMRLSQDEKDIVAEMTKENAQPLNILARIKNKYKDNVSNLRNVYNERRNVHKADMAGASPMKVLLSQLHSKGYVHDYQVNESSNAVEQLFFVHPTSHKLWRAFPHVLLIDSTYKTNKYRMPFLEMVGVTSTSKTFCVGFAVLMKERQQDFIWALSKLKQTLDKCVMPRVIITDRDLGLVNACKQVFPEASHQLCRFHIFQNICKHCKPSFGKQEEWEAFERMWARVISSPTPESFERNRNRLRDALLGSGRMSKYDY